MRIVLFSNWCITIVSLLTMKNKLNYILSYLRFEGIRIDQEELNFQLETHPDYPSLYAVSDTLNFLKVNNIALQVNSEQIDLLPQAFVALIEIKGETQPFLSFIKRKGNDFQYQLNGKTKQVDKHGLTDMWKNVVLIVENTNTHKKKRSKAINWPHLFAFVILIGMCSYITSAADYDTRLLSLLGFTLAGLFLSIEALKQSFGVSSSFSESVCNSGAIKASDCQSVITSDKAWRLLGLELSDLSLLFFAGQLMAMLLMASNGAIDVFVQYLMVLLILSIPISLYSLYYQKFVEKKWCPICLMVIAVIYSQIGLLLLTRVAIPGLANWHAMVAFGLGFMLSLLIWLAAKPHLKEFARLVNAEKKLLRFKRNYQLFKLALLDSTAYDAEVLNSPIQLGNPNAKLQITYNTSLFCGHCVKSHAIVEGIMERYSDDILINLRFSYMEQNAEFAKDLHVNLLSIYFEKGQQAFFEALSYWFKHKDIDAWNKRYYQSDADKHNIERMLKKQMEENVKYEMQFTPAILISNRLYPNIYEREELVVFIKELIDDENFLHGAQSYNNYNEAVNQFPS